jgi:hypothetical protein
MTAAEVGLRDFLLRCGKTDNLPKTIAEAAAHIRQPYDVTATLIQKLEREEHIFFETDPTRNTGGEPSKRSTDTRGWWEPVPRNGPAPYIP